MIIVIDKRCVSNLYNKLKIIYNGEADDCEKKLKDGTFKINPENMNQVWVLRGLI